MATSLDFIEYVTEQVSGCGDVRYQKMFGEYMVYINDKPLLLVCDNSVFVKILPCLDEVMRDAERGYPYDGAKEHYILDIDHTELTRAVIAALEPVTPLPKPRKRKREGDDMPADKEKRQLFRNPDAVPTEESIAKGLGAAYGIYMRFVKELKDGYGITLMDWRFYHDGKAWLSKGEYKWTTPRGTNKVKPVFWLSMWEGFFKVSFFFSTDAKDDLLSLPLAPETKDSIQNANPMGKAMRFMSVILDIEHDMQLDDIFALAQFRKARVK